MRRLWQKLGLQKAVESAYGKPLQPATGPEPYRLSDGSTVAIRPLLPSDKEALARGFAELSAESRYARFFTARKELTSDELRYLTELDGIRHFALAAHHVDDEGHDNPLGVARFVRESADSQVAEAAVTVVDAAQGKGLGKLLLWRLGQEAYARGVRRFRCTILASNVVVHKMIHHMGSSARVLSRQGGVVELEFDLPPPEGVERVGLVRRKWKRLLRGR